MREVWKEIKQGIDKKSFTIALLLLLLLFVIAVFMVSLIERSDSTISTYRIKLQTSQILLNKTNFTT